MGVQQEQAVVELVIKGKNANATLKDLEKSGRALRAQMKGLALDSQDFADKQKDLQKVEKRLRTIREEIKGTSGMFQKLGKEIKAFGLVTLGFLAFQWGVGKVQSIIKSNADLSDSFANIRKTTNMTQAEVIKLNKAFSQMDTRTATKELREIAIGAGQLGIAKHEIFSFTAAVDKMVVSLGDEFTGGAFEITKVMGGLRNVFTDIKTSRIDQDILHIGNAVNVLAASGAATGPVVTDFANRIGGVGISLGLTSGQVLGISATLQELSVTTERGGTAVSRILQKMTVNIAEFAKVADMDAQAFAKLVNEDLYGAFLKVVQGSKEGGASATAFGKILKDLDVDGAGASEVVSKLGADTGLLARKVALANDALKGTDSILAEFNLKNNTLGAELDKLGKSFHAAFTNSAVSNGLKNAVSWLADLFDNTKKVSESLQEENSELRIAEANLLSYNVGNENRTKLIKELQDKYPDYLGNLNAETVGHEELSRAIAKVNDHLVNKIIIQKQDEEIQEQAEKLAEARIRSAQARVKVLTDLSDIYAQNQVNLFKGAKVDLKKELAGLGMNVQAEEILKYDTFTGAGLSNYNAAIVSLRKNYADWKDAEAALSKEKMLSNDLDAEKKKLLKELGIQTEEFTAKAEKQAKTSGKFTDPETLKKEEAELKRHLEELKKAQEKFYLDVEELEKKNSERYLGDRDREKAAVYAKYRELLGMAQANSQEQEVILEAQQNELLDIDKKYDKLALKAKEEYYQERRRLENTEMQNEIDAVVKLYDEVIEKALEHNDEAISLELRKWEAIQEIQRKYREQQKQTNKQTPEEKKAERMRLKDQQEIYQAYYGTLNKLINFHNQKQQAIYNAEIERINKNTDAGIIQQKRLLDNKIISQEEYDVRIANLEKEREKRQREIQVQMAQAEKNAATFSAIINGAVAITEVWSKHAANPYTAGLLTAAAVANTALQIATINMAQVPQYAKGGYVEKPTLFSSTTGSNFIAGEAGEEWIAPNWMLKDPIYANTIGMLEAARKGRVYEKGGSTTTSTPRPVFANASGSLPSQEVASLVLVINKLNDLLTFISNNGLEAYLDYDRTTRDFNSIDNARQSASI